MPPCFSLPSLFTPFSDMRKKPTEREKGTTFSRQKEDGRAGGKRFHPPFYGGEKGLKYMPYKKV